jgi:hypothetical protein
MLLDSTFPITDKSVYADAAQCSYIQPPTQERPAICSYYFPWQDLFGYLATITELRASLRPSNRFRSRRWARAVLELRDTE